MLKAHLREKMRWPHDKAAFPVGNKPLFGIKLGVNSALAMYLDTNEYRISCVSWSYWIWKERTARQQISDTCLVPCRARSLIWGIYELIMKEHGAKRVTGRGPSLLARTRRLFPSSLTRASHSSPVPRFKSPCSPLSLWNWVKPEEEKVVTPKPQTTSQATLCTYQCKSRGGGGVGWGTKPTPLILACATDRTKLWVKSICKTVAKS